MAPANGTVLLKTSTRRPTNRQGKAARALKQNNQSAGFSLIELIVAMVIIAVSVGGLLSAIGGVALRSSNPEFQYEALNIAQSYMAEILSHNRILSAGGGCAVGGQPNRAIRSRICDYNATSDTPPRDRGGNVIAGLGGYTVNVTVNVGNANSLIDGLGGPGDDTVARVDVAVTSPDPLTTSVILHSYKTSCSAAAANLGLPGSC